MTSLVIFNFCVYLYFISLQKEKNSVILNSYTELLSRYLIDDLSTILEDNFEETTPLFLFKLFSNKSENSKLPNKLEITPYGAYVNTSRGRYIFDLQEFREILDNLLPHYISYLVKINNSNIALSDDYTQSSYDLKKQYNIDRYTQLDILLSIRKNSEFYLLAQDDLYAKLIYSFPVSTLLILFILYLHLKANKRVKMKFDLLEANIEELRTTNTALVRNKKVTQLLKNLFINKATEIYIKQAIGEDKKAKNLKNNPSKNNYMFPIVLYDCKDTEIETKLLRINLEEYFSCYYMTIALRVSCSVSAIRLKCAPEVFYQIIFSLIFNLFEFMDQQSDSPKAMEINFTEQNILITYDSFRLDEDLMVQLSDKILDKNMDIFFLSCCKIFSSLKNHGFLYELDHFNDQNTIKIHFPIAANVLKDEGQVFEFSKYTRLKK